MKAVSIIIPVYNAEKYLRKCLETCVSQSLKNIEVIVVNDASPDRSHIIMQEYEDRYPQKVKCIYLTENIKQGGARNRGIEIAKGKFIMFVDADDYVDTRICEKMYRLAEAKKADQVFSDIYRIDGNGKFIYQPIYVQRFMGKTSNNKKISLLLTPNLSACFRLIKKSIITDCSLYFPEGIQGEDQVIVNQWIFQSKKISKVDEGLYFYQHTPESTSNKINSEHNFRIKDIIQTIDPIIESSNGEIRQAWECFRILLIIYAIEHFMSRFSYKPNKEIKELLSLIDDEQLNLEYNPYVKKVIMPEKIYLLKHVTEDDFDKEIYKEKVFDNYYKRFVSEIMDLFQYIYNRGIKKIALWGAGVRGKDLLEVLEELKIQIEVVDKSEELQNTYLPSGHKVRRFEDISHYLDLVIVTNIYLYEEIKKKVKECDKRVFVLDLDYYLKYNQRTYNLIE